MQCPVDGTVLQLSERQGVEIDYCPQCRGVWLDRGEIDKIIERSATYDAAPPPASRQEPPRPQYRDDRAGGYPQGGYPKKKKHKSLLEELFDFG